MAPRSRGPFGEETNIYDTKAAIRNETGLAGSFRHPPWRDTDDASAARTREQRRPRPEQGTASALLQPVECAERHQRPGELRARRIRDEERRWASGAYVDAANPGRGGGGVFHGSACRLGRRMAREPKAAMGRAAARPLVHRNAGWLACRNGPGRYPLGTGYRHPRRRGWSGTPLRAGRCRTLRAA